MTNPFEPLLELVASAAEITLERNSALRVKGPAGLLAGAKTFAGHRELLAAVAVGRRGQVSKGTFHALAPCDLCGRPSMVAVTAERLAGRATWPRCRMTPDCERSDPDTKTVIIGRHRPLPADLARAQAQKVRRRGRVA